MKVIPIPASAGITGFESPAAEYNQLDLSLDELLVERPSSTFLGFANGDSMTGLGIFDGDLLIVDRFPVAQHNDVIVANLNGEFICKVLDMTNRQLLSANSKYSSVTITENDQFTIEGIVVGSIRMFRKSYLLSA
ncbi:translesion error-prone DNA polymerase V autoproteolytic subunit [Vibrio parahaemolyticus]|jgi:DNA polymerase V|uniref:Translesion error-prone DNA polymerase V autoproteolytic subunit n=1 Tax=Vibrio alginolyticus TaxID=663 RepID=A0A7Y0MSZ0_VIBAL|nr:MULTISPECIES: translesion error-prone DNA polymerase V autoproteolytic subunit [Vibrio]EGQ7798746.1 translesion error-prone DNA polymerase V autoproteolytic subunit [Vibrio parahaemolyticus]EGQ8110443.1 translesion error-prone DNA polymerase V autoproteolytic subunit [Vibrio parahaemolyticus]EGU0148040.1 translesion error-prone DNA polymerase V autoproteolytic subunit [Vibrio parahaemolyticus]EHA6960515.1 translesion error-prone DNA polymerase V autoproteolytic subunit [Vibrio parahaemolytic